MNIQLNISTWDEEITSTTKCHFTKLPQIRIGCTDSIPQDIKITSITKRGSAKKMPKMNILFSNTLTEDEVVTFTHKCHYKTWLLSKTGHIVSIPQELKVHQSAEKEA